MVTSSSSSKTGPKIALDDVAAAFVIFTAPSMLAFASNHNFASATRISTGNYQLRLAPEIASATKAVAVITASIAGVRWSTEVVSGGPNVAVVEVLFFDVATGAPADASFYVHVDILP